jgi:hypothetical protein
MTHAPVPRDDPALPVAPAIDSYSHLYTDTNWVQLHVKSQRVLRESDIPTEGVVNTRQQLYEDVKATCNEILHAYLTMV